MKSPVIPLVVLVISVIVILLVGYYYNEPFVIRDSFHALRFALYLGGPLLLNFFFFKIPLRDLGLAKPKLTKQSMRWLTAIVILAPLIIFLIRLDPAYLREYAFYQGSSRPLSERLSQWTIFTLSTLIGWEFLLRGYFLFGLRALLNERLRVREEIANTIVILWVCSFETLYHFVKPDLEAIGMLVASPVLSWIALKSRSLWPSLFLHLYIEFIFIFVLIF